MPTWIAALSSGTQRLVGGCGVALLVLLGFMARQTATGFTSDSHQLDAMTQMRPRDPSGHIRNAWFAARTGDVVTARRSLRNARRAFARGAVEAEAETGASRAAVQRNLDTLQSRGLVREVTGRGRFRVWAAKL